jgi:hypothetical protein
MPRFKQNKIKVDPRYFLNEKIEIEEIVVDPAGQAAALAQRGMRQAAGLEEVPPWEAQPSKDYKNAHNKEEARMHRTNLYEIHKDSKILMRLVQDRDDLPEWCEGKITEAAAGLESVLEYIMGNKAREKGEL